MHADCSEIIGSSLIRGVGPDRRGTCWWGKVRAYCCIVGVADPRIRAEEVLYFNETGKIDDLG